MNVPFGKKQSMSILAATLLVGGSFSVPLVLAAEAAPCGEEIEKYCGHLKPGEGILNCLQEHARDLSPDCRETLAANRKKLESARQLCAADTEKFCKGVVPGGGRILKCLSGHRDELAPECRNLVSGWLKQPVATPKPVGTVKENSVEKPAKIPGSAKPVAPTPQ